MGQKKSVGLWNASLVCQLFKKGENVHVWKTKAWHNICGNVCASCGAFQSSHIGNV